MDTGGEKDKVGSVETLRYWLLKEADYHTIALESSHGMSVYSNRHSSRRQNRQSDDRGCTVCGRGHDISDCDDFVNMSVKDRWDTAHSYGLCFRCLKHNDIGQVCPHTRICGVGGCQHNHHRMLHSSR